MKKDLYKFDKYQTLSGLSVQSWRFTSSNEEELYDSETYEPKIISKSEIPKKPEISKNNVVISFSILDEFARNWFNDCYFSFLKLELIENFNGIITIKFIGKLSNIKYKGNHIEMTFNSDYSELGKASNNLIISRTCQHRLYDESPFTCLVNKAAYAVPATITSISNNTLTISEALFYDDGYFTLGLLDDGQGDLIYIIQHLGSSIRVNKLPSYIEDEFYENSSVDVTIYPGCNKNIRTCDEKFNNKNNFGGQPFSPNTDYSKQSLR